jgi:outer membrane biosynthesis protein TonB
MKFSTAAALALVAPSATGFTPFQRRAGIPQSLLKVSYDLDLGDEYAPKKVKKAAPAPAPVPAPPPAPVPEPVQAKRAVKKKEPAPLPPPAEPVKAKKPAPKKAEPVAPRPAPAPVVRAKTVKTPPVVAIPAPPRKPVAVATKDPNAVAGVAIGGAPLLLAPLAALAAGRSILSGTVARRERIQKEIEEFEKAKAKKAIQADIDGDALAGAVVRILSSHERYRWCRPNYGLAALSRKVLACSVDSLSLSILLFPNRHI